MDAGEGRSLTEPLHSAIFKQGREYASPGDYVLVAHSGEAIEVARAKGAAIPEWLPGGE